MAELKVPVSLLGDGVVALPLKQFEKMKFMQNHLMNSMHEELERRLAAEKLIQKYRDVVGAKMKEFGRLASDIIEIDESKCQDIRSYAMSIRGKANCIAHDACRDLAEIAQWMDEEYCLQCAQDDGWELVGPTYDDEDSARSAAAECRKKYPGHKYRVVSRPAPEWRPLEDKP